MALLALAPLFGRGRFDFRSLALLLGVWVLYLGAGTAVAILSPQKVMAIGEDRCIDEMCFAVTGFHRATKIEAGGAVTRPRGVFYIVEARVSNHSRGRAEREAGRTGLVLDDAGRAYPVSPEGMQALALAEGPLPGLDTEVASGQSVSTKLVFDLPAGVTHPAFTLSSSLAFNPATIVIGDDMHFLHKPTIVPLD